MRPTQIETAHGIHHPSRGPEHESPAASAFPSGGPSDADVTPQIPEHTLVRCIGHGSYGEVWLARNAIGVPRAVKIVYRRRFSEDRPYDREYAGMRHYEPVSRSHLGLVDILQLGRNDDAGYFYYVMELADDFNTRDAAQHTGNKVTSPHGLSPSTRCALETYVPHTLREEQRLHGRLSVETCISIGSVLADALGYLHRQGLVHRDVKPSNVIFADGIPKLADIGLVAGLDEARSFVGTEGFIPPEGPGAPQADLYSLGKLLYEISTGKDRNEFPALPADLQDRGDREAFAEWNELLVKACATDLRERYRTAEEMHRELAMLQVGESLRRQRARMRRWRVAGWIGLVSLLLTVVAGSFWSNWLGVAAVAVALVVYAISYVRFRQSPLAPSTRTAAVPVLPRQSTPVIAVLPFENSSPDERDAFLGDELAVEFAARLARVPDLKVLPRHSAKSLQSAADLLALARGIRVDAVLVGTVRRCADRLHLGVELINTADGILRWSQSYDVPVGEVFALQTNCALQVTETLGVSLPETLRQQVAQSATRDLCAYDYYLLGRRYLNNRTPQDFVMAANLFEQAVAADPAYALAYAGLADAYQYLGYGFGTESAREIAPKARTAALKAVELAPHLAETHTSLAIVRALLDWDWNGAEKEYQQALSLNPRYPETHHFYGFFLTAIRERPDSGVAEARHALELDPLSLPLNNFVGVMLFFAGRFEESIQYQRQWLETVPKPAGAEHELCLSQKILGRAHECLGRHEEAVAYYLRELDYHGVPAAEITRQREAFDRDGWTGFWQTRMAGLLALWEKGGQPWLIAYEIALTHARLGETDQVFECLNRLYEVRCSMLVWLKVEPLLAPVRADPRYRDLLSKIGLDKAQV